MSAPFIGEIAIFPYGFAPQGWAPCQGQIMPISSNTALFSVLGTIYGGNGRTTFALPNLDCIPVGAGQGPGLSEYSLGETGGEAALPLLASQMPSHRHPFNVSTDQAKSASPGGNQLGRAWVAQANTDNVANFYSPNPGNAKAALSPNALGANGGNQPHNNMQPYLALQFCIALQGVYPRSGPTDRMPYLGEVAICAFGFPPRGFLLCEGQLLPINANQALFSLLGTTYGGDGRTTFALPDLRGRVPLGTGQNYSLGQFGGQEAHVLAASEMASHTHVLMGDAITTSGIGNTPSTKTVLGCSSGAVVPGNTPFTADLYSTAAPSATLSQTIGDTGSGQAHENRMPSLVLSFCIQVDRNAQYPSHG